MSADERIHMNTKIIYISGAEIFDMADVRAAFDEVRSALSLPADTILFGVPVDQESAINNQDTVVEPIPEPEPVVKKPRARKVIEPESNPKSDAPVIPILSVLSAKEEPIPTKIEDIVLDDTPIAVCATEKTLEELLENMVPLKEDVEQPECEIEIESPFADALGNKIESDPLSPDGYSEASTDATLSKLAAEFADAQNVINDDDVPPVAKALGGKPARSSSIGKLKNILPFKKAKNNEGSLMGDLFGWAGVAANDDDLGMPGFFATAK